MYKLICFFKFFNCSESFQLENNNIPLIIHQTWKNKNPEGKLKYGMNSWKSLNPEFEHRLWDDNDCINFIKFLADAIISVSATVLLGNDIVNYFVALT